MKNNNGDFARTIARHVVARMPMAEGLFATLVERTPDPSGVGLSRDSYGAGEKIAHDLVAETAASLDLEVTRDLAGNLYVTLPGADRVKPVVMTGSHLDTVHRGGNFDGGAGVMAGFTALAALKDLGHQPAQDLTVMATRCEESGSWFTGRHGGHIGARAALGLLWPDELETAVRIDTGRTLAQHMRESGFDPAALLDNPPHLEAARIGKWIELHIEQGPVLAARELPVGIVTDIRGFLSVRAARCFGEWAHAGGTPAEYRHDALMATVDLVHELELAATSESREDDPVTLTVGRFVTDERFHSITKVPGEVTFSMDIRSRDPAVLDRMESLAHQLAEDIGKRRRVRFDFGTFAPTPAARMDPELGAVLSEGCRELGIPEFKMTCGASHDTVDFVAVGIPSAMIFVRNFKGSHNPDEMLEMDDFCLGTQLLAYFLAKE
jgi:beta-ureidopropionase / N-carbamoyl-L-amino-acid hydrolase